MKQLVLLAAFLSTVLANPNSRNVTLNADVENQSIEWNPLPIESFWRQWFQRKRAMDQVIVETKDQDEVVSRRRSILTPETSDDESDDLISIQALVEEQKTPQDQKTIASNITPTSEDETHVIAPSSPRKSKVIHTLLQQGSYLSRLFVPRVHPVEKSIVPRRVSIPERKHDLSASISQHVQELLTLIIPADRMKKYPNEWTRFATDIFENLLYEHDWMRQRFESTVAEPVQRRKSLQSIEHPKCIHCSDSINSIAVYAPTAPKKYVDALDKRLQALALHPVIEMAYNASYEEISIICVVQHLKGHLSSTVKEWDSINSQSDKTDIVLKRLEMQFSSTQYDEAYAWFQWHILRSLPTDFATGKISLDPLVSLYHHLNSLMEKHVLDPDASVDIAILFEEMSSLSINALPWHWNATALVCVTDLTFLAWSPCLDGTFSLPVMRVDPVLMQALRDDMNIDFSGKPNRFLPLPMTKHYKFLKWKNLSEMVIHLVEWIRNQLGLFEVNMALPLMDKKLANFMQFRNKLGHDIGLHQAWQELRMKQGEILEKRMRIWRSLLNRFEKLKESSLSVIRIFQLTNIIILSIEEETKLFQAVAHSVRQQVYQFVTELSDVNYNIRLLILLALAMQDSVDEMMRQETRGPLLESGQYSPWFTWNKLARPIWMWEGIDSERMDVADLWRWVGVSVDIQAKYLHTVREQQ